MPFFPHFYYYEKVNQITYLSSKKCANCLLYTFSFLQIAKPSLAPTADAGSQAVNMRTWCVRAQMRVTIKLNFSHTTDSIFFYPQLFPDLSVPNSRINLQLPPEFCCAMVSSVE